MIYIKKDEVKPTNLFNGFYKPITKNLLIYRKDIKNLYVDMEEKNIEIFLKNGYKYNITFIQDWMFDKFIKSFKHVLFKQ